MTSQDFLTMALLVLLTGYMANGAAKKILLVDDNDDVRGLLALFIKNLGYKVFEAATGSEAINRASTLHPDLIMMDLALPGMSGDEATICLKANPATRDIPVLISTAYAAGVDTERALHAGAAEILVKPLDLARLREVLSRYLPTQEGATSN
ncbi:MAG TPA: response regulator [Candidatus Binatia bacterium]